jgi:GGDEF domain-containing protein
MVRAFGDRVLQSVVKRLLGCLGANKPFEIDSHKVRITASIGVATATASIPSR